MIKCRMTKPWQRPLTEHAGEFARDEGDLVPQAVGGLDIVQHGDGGGAGEAESEKATTRIQREGFRTFDADERGKAAQLTGDVGSLTLELGSVRFRCVGVAEDVRTV